MRDRYKGKYPATKADQLSQKQKLMDEYEQEKLEGSYRALFTGLGGPGDARRVYEDLLEFCMIGRVTMTGNSWTYFNEGKRAVGEFIRSRLGLKHSVKEVIDAKD